MEISYNTTPDTMTSKQLTFLKDAIKKAMLGTHVSNVIRESTQFEQSGHYKADISSSSLSP